MNSIPIVVITPVKNEDWIIEIFLKVTSTFADLIIIADQYSSDASREIAASFKKVVLIENDILNWNYLIQRENINRVFKKSENILTNALKRIDQKKRKSELLLALKLASVNDKKKLLNQLNDISKTNLILQMQ